jgi:hypothetical protein
VCGTPPVADSRAHVHVCVLPDPLLPQHSTSPSFTLHLGTLGSLSLSPALVLRLQALFTSPGADWQVESL